MGECNCDLRTRMVGAGCEVCNPALALECAKETISDLKSQIADVGAQNKSLKLMVEDAVAEGNLLRASLAKLDGK